MAAPGGEPVRWERIARGQHSGHDASAPEVLTLESAEAWRDFWRRHTRNRFPPPDAPAVDFDAWWVAAALMGRQATGGYAVEVREVRYDAAAGAYTVAVDASEPPADAVVIQTLTSPFDIVRVERAAEGPVVAALEVA